MKIRRFKEKGFCIYCGEEKIHKAFKEEQLCSSCASDLIERSEWENRMGWKNGEPPKIKHTRCYDAF